MIGSSLKTISRRSTSRSTAGALTTIPIQRFMGTGSSKKSRKQAMKRQRKLNPPPPEESSKGASSSQSDGFFTESSPLGSRIISEPITPSTGSFDNVAGLSKLQLRPSLDDYLEKYDLTEHPHERPSSAVPVGSSAPTWESNKGVGTTLLNPNGGQLLRNSSSMTNGKTNRNILTDQDDDGFLIDRDSMFDPTIHLPHAPKDWKGYEPATPLSEFLMQRIGVSGQPISTAEYMRHALTHPLYGYYTSKDQAQADDDDDDWDKDDYDIDEPASSDPSESTGKIFGRSGDFVTAPELSSVFGHSLCVWFMTVWQQEPLGKPKDIQFVELGPGRGTLMADLLELAHSSKLMDFGKSIRTVHLVETSRELRKQQQETIQKAVGHLVKLEFVNGDDAEKEDTGDEESFVNTIRIEWHDTFSAFQASRDKTVPTMVLMQEFLDALPVHQFQKTEDGWRERMIDVVSTEDEAVPTQDSASSEKPELIPRLRQVLAPNVTPAVELLLSSNQNQYDHFPEGTVVEICPDALFLIQDVAKVLEESQGAALIIDYGEEGTADTLRAFSNHQQVPLTSRPGRVDVTADVDFFAIKNCLSVDAFKRNKDDKADDETIPTSIHAFGPVAQGEFLMKMGAGELTMSAIEKDETTEEQAQAFADALRYLVMPEHMGEKFKVLALSRKRDGFFGPAGIE